MKVTALYVKVATEGKKSPGSKIVIPVYIRLCVCSVRQIRHKLPNDRCASYYCILVHLSSADVNVPNIATFRTRSHQPLLYP